MRLIYIATGLLLFVACSKDQWKITVPTDVSLQLTSKHYIINSQSFLKIDTLEVELSSLSLEGSRIQAENIYLATDVNSVELTDSLPMIISNFDIPQGTYQDLRMDMALTNVSGTTLSIKGVYHPPSGGQKLVHILLQTNDVIEKQILENGLTTVLVEEGTSKKILLQLDPEVLFDGVPLATWNAAVQSNIYGTQGILVNSSTNGNIYNKLINNIHSSFSAHAE